MITLVNFLLLIEALIYYNKNDIDKGYTPFKIYQICGCIREAFCLSYSIRKNNNLFLYFQREHILIKFVGKKLRYLGPDERSQALLLLRGIQKISNINRFEEQNLIECTPGIYGRKYPDNESFINFFKSEKFYFIINPTQNSEVINFFTSILELDEVNENHIYILPMYIISKNKTKIITLFKDLKNLSFLSIPKISLVENQILYINFMKDNQTKSSYL